MGTGELLVKKKKKTPANLKINSKCCLTSQHIAFICMVKWNKLFAVI